MVRKILPEHLAMCFFSVLAITFVVVGRILVKLPTQSSKIVVKQTKELPIIFLAISATSLIQYDISNKQVTNLLQLPASVKHGMLYVPKIV